MEENVSGCFFSEHSVHFVPKRAVACIKSAAVRHLLVQQHCLSVQSIICTVPAVISVYYGLNKERKKEK